MGPFELDIKGLKCDAPGCGWRDDSITRRQYDRRRNTACPACGANVLTDADFRKLRRIERTVAVFNVLLFWIKPKPGRPENVYRINTDGTGRATVKRIS